MKQLYEVISHKSGEGAGVYWTMHPRRQCTVSKQKLLLAKLYKGIIRLQESGIFALSYVEVHIRVVGEQR